MHGLENGEPVVQPIARRGPPAAWAPPVGDQSVFVSLDLVPAARGTSRLK
jgi:hypothetical protein